MHKLLDEKIKKEIMLLGNESIARGAIEAGVAFALIFFKFPKKQIFILNTAPMKKLPWKLLLLLQIQDFVQCVL